MFTGIITDIGRIVVLEERGDLRARPADLHTSASCDRARFTSAARLAGAGAAAGASACSRIDLDDRAVEEREGALDGGRADCDAISVATNACAPADVHAQSESQKRHTSIKQCKANAKIAPKRGKDETSVEAQMRIFVLLRYHVIKCVQ